VKQMKVFFEIPRQNEHLHLHVHIRVVNAGENLGWAMLKPKSLGCAHPNHPCFTSEGFQTYFQLGCIKGIATSKVPQPIGLGISAYHSAASAFISTVNHNQQHSR